MATGHQDFQAVQVYPRYGILNHQRTVIPSGSIVGTNNLITLSKPTVLLGFLCNGNAIPDFTQTHLNLTIDGQSISYYLFFTTIGDQVGGPQIFGIQFKYITTLEGAFGVGSDKTIHIGESLSIDWEENSNATPYELTFDAYYYTTGQAVV